MKQDVFQMSIIIEGTTEKASRFKTPLKVILQQNLMFFYEQKCTYETL
jgi:hypothetical protein